MRFIKILLFVFVVIGLQGCLTKRYIPQEGAVPPAHVQLESIGNARVNVTADLTGRINAVKSSAVRDSATGQINTWFTGTGPQVYNVNYDLKVTRGKMNWPSFFAYLFTLTLIPAQSDYFLEAELSITDGASNPVYKDTIPAGRVREYLAVYFPTPLLVGRMGSHAGVQAVDGTLSTLKSRLAQEESNQSNAYFPVESKNTIDGYKSFLNQYPQSFYRSQALQRLAKLVGKQRNSQQAFAALLSQYPDIRPYMPAKDGIYYVGPAGMTVADIQQKLKEGMDSAILVSLIKSAGQPYKRFTLDETFQLRKLNIPSDIVAAMIDVSAQQPQVAPAATVAPIIAVPQPAQQSVIAPTTAATQPQTLGQQAGNAAQECAKAYAAKKACEKLPSDPLGLVRKGCMKQVKKKFGGLGCPIPL